jgi:hypothetical protein
VSGSDTSAAIRESSDRLKPWALSRQIRLPPPRRIDMDELMIISRVGELSMRLRTSINRNSDRVADFSRISSSVAMASAMS